jgi:Cryptococcal mannosyltransferase 1.
MNTKPFFIVLSGLLCLLVFFNAFLVSNLDSVPIDQDYNYFIAANYYNSEESLLYSLPELEKVINYLKKGNNIFVSFVENGSTDNTKSILKDFESKLKVSNKIVFCEYPGSTTWKIGKILGEEYIKKIYKQKPLIRFQMMAGIRNAALNPLYFSPFSNNLPIKVLFLNDIFYTAHDILTLLNTNNGNFDIACGLDFYYQFYDVLVTRDLEGFWFSGFYPYVKHKESLKLLKENQAFKVLAC